MEENGDGGRNTDTRNGTDPHSDAGSDGADLDELLCLVSERRRRYVLYVMRERHTEDLTGLARRVAAELAETTPDAVDETHREAIETLLVHADVPALAAADLVSYDRQTETLRLESLPEPLETVLEACATLDDIDPSAGEAAEGATSDTD